MRNTALNSLDENLTNRNTFSLTPLRYYDGPFGCRRTCGSSPPQDSAEPLAGRRSAWPPFSPSRCFAPFRSRSSFAASPTRCSDEHLVCRRILMDSSPCRGSDEPLVSRRSAWPPFSSSRCFAPFGSRNLNNLSAKRYSHYVEGSRDRCVARGPEDGS
jgi:hypothetical protein